MFSIFAPTIKAERCGSNMLMIGQVPGSKKVFQLRVINASAAKRERNLGNNSFQQIQ